MIDLSDVYRNISFDQWFSVFFIIHLANLRSVKIVQKSGKSQGIFQLLMSGNLGSRNTPGRFILRKPWVSASLMGPAPGSPVCRLN